MKDTPQTRVIRKADGVNMLIVPDVQEADSGTFHCVAKNEVTGEGAVTTCELNVYAVQPGNSGHSGWLYAVFFQTAPSSMVWGPVLLSSIVLRGLSLIRISLCSVIEKVQFLLQQCCMRSLDARIELYQTNEFSDCWCVLLFLIKADRCRVW